MSKKRIPFQRYEQEFLIAMLLFSCFMLYTLSAIFIMPIVFAVIVTCASYPLFVKVNDKVKNESISSFIMVSGVAFIVLFPMLYLLGVMATTVYELYQNNQDYLNQMNVAELENLKDKILSYLPISNETASYIGKEITDNTKVIFGKSQEFLVRSSKSLLDNSISVIFFLGFSLFTMYFLYIDGIKVANKIKNITPLENSFDTLIMQEIYSLCGILTISVFSVAILQGLSFSVLTYFMDLNWFFIGIAICVASFIPGFGAALVWVPLSLYLVTQGFHTKAIVVAIWGLVVAGTIIDNFLRPLIIKRVSIMFDSVNSCDLSKFNPLGNFFIVLVSTIGGVVCFDVVGVFLGPILASTAIIFFDIYEQRIKAAEEPLVNECAEQSNEELEHHNSTDLGNKNDDIDDEKLLLSPDSQLKQQDL